MENNTIESILKRRSTRRFKPTPINRETLELLMKAAMAAPTGLDKRPWEFIIVDNEKDIKRLYDVTNFDSRFNFAPAAIIVCGNTDISELWYIDCSCAAQNILIAATSLGLGGVYTAAYPREERMEHLSKHFDLPGNIIPLCVIPIGYPEEELSPKEKYDPSRIHCNEW